jgi:hypothetical protein
MTMPVKIFDSSTDGIAGLEAKINAWMETLESGAVRYLSTSAPGGSEKVVVTVWYTEAKDKN